MPARPCLDGCMNGTRIVERIITGVIVRVASREITSAIYRKRNQRRSYRRPGLPGRAPMVSSRWMWIIAPAVIGFFIVLNLAH